MAYSVRAKLAADETVPRIGLRGSARVQRAAHHTILLSVSSTHHRIAPNHRGIKWISRFSAKIYAFCQAGKMRPVKMSGFYGDPLRHQYFALGRTALLLLRYLPKISSLEDLKNSLAKDDATVDDHEIEQFRHFYDTYRLEVASNMLKELKLHKKRGNAIGSCGWCIITCSSKFLIRPDRFLNGLLREYLSHCWKTRAHSNLHSWRIRRFIPFLAMGCLSNDI